MIQRENYAFNYQGFDQIDKRKKRKKIAHRALDEHWLSPASSQKCWHSIDSNVAFVRFRRKKNCKVRKKHTTIEHTHVQSTKQFAEMD